jgi:hypothetical protein
MGRRYATVTAAVAASWLGPPGLRMIVHSLTGCGTAFSVRVIDGRSIARRGTWPTTT